jgi:hypothetical protein
VFLGKEFLFLYIYINNLYSIETGIDSTAEPLIIGMVRKMVCTLLALSPVT